MHVLNVVSGPASGRSLELEHDVVIGREGCDLEIDDRQLSRRHAVLRVSGDSVVVEDLDSLNGTFVNGVRIAEPTPVTKEDKLTLGTSEIRVEWQADPTVLSPAIADPEVTRLSGSPMADVQTTRVAATASPPADVAASAAAGGGAAASTALPPSDGQVADSGSTAPRRPPTKVLAGGVLVAALVGAGVAIGWFAGGSSTTKTVTVTHAASASNGGGGGQVPPVSVRYVGAGFLSATSDVTGALAAAGATHRDLGGHTSMGVSITGHPFAVLGLVTLQPGAQTGWHIHPNGLDGFILVSQGTITMYVAKDPRCRPHTLTKGQVAFIGGTVEHDIRNEGSIPAKVFALSFFGHPVQPQNAFAPRPKPSSCPF